MTNLENIKLIRASVQFRPLVCFGKDLELFQVPPNCVSSEIEPGTLFVNHESRVVHFVADADNNYMFTWDPNSRTTTVMPNPFVNEYNFANPSKQSMLGIVAITVDIAEPRAALYANWLNDCMGNKKE